MDDYRDANEAALARKDREINRLSTLVAQLQDQLTAMQLHESELADKYRKRLTAAISELRLAQKGLTSGCGCPIGVCLKPKDPLGAQCWKQWAGLSVLRDAANQQIDAMMRAGNHPRRMTEITDGHATKRDAKDDQKPALPPGEGG